MTEIQGDLHYRDIQEQHCDSGKNTRNLHGRGGAHKRRFWSPPGPNLAANHEAYNLTF